MRVGVLTGGGDSPGLNAVIRAIVRKGETVYGDEVVGFLDAWDGVLKQETMPLSVRTLRGMLPKGGTLLGTRRGSPFDEPDGVNRVLATFETLGIDALIVIGGNGSLTVACMLHEQVGLPVVGVLLVFVVYAIGFLFAAAAAGLSEAVSVWLALLIVGAALLLIAALGVFLAMRSARKALPPKPAQAIEEGQATIGMLKDHA